MDWSSLSIPPNLYKLHLNDDTVSSVDTDDEVFDDDFDKNIQNEAINAQKQIQSIDIPEESTGTFFTCIKFRKEVNFVKAYHYF